MFNSNGTVQPAVNDTRSAFSDDSSEDQLLCRSMCTRREDRGLFLISFDRGFNCYMGKEQRRGRRPEKCWFARTLEPHFLVTAQVLSCLKSVCVPAHCVAASVSACSCGAELHAGALSHVKRTGADGEREGGRCPELLHTEDRERSRRVFILRGLSMLEPRRLHPGTHEAEPFAFGVDPTFFQVDMKVPHCRILLVQYMVVHGSIWSTTRERDSSHDWIISSRPTKSPSHRFLSALVLAAGVVTELRLQV